MSEKELEERINKNYASLKSKEILVKVEGSEDLQ